MKYLVALLALTGCTMEHKYYQVVCDSGFKTPVSYRTYITDSGLIKWKVHANSPKNYRKIKPNEICNDILIESK